MGRLAALSEEERCLALRALAQVDSACSEALVNYVVSAYLPFITSLASTADLTLRFSS